MPVAKRVQPDAEKSAIAPEQSIGYQVRRLNQDMSETLNSFVSRHGISNAQWGYLRHIYFEDGISQRELSDRIGRQGPSTVVALKRLDQAGYVEIRKNSHDQRKNKVFLTKKGQTLVTELMPYVDKVQAIAFRGFSVAEYDVFWRLISRMRANFAQRLVDGERMKDVKTVV